MEKKHLNRLALLRIIACLSVFNGHFWGIALVETQTNILLQSLRDGFVSNTVISYFYMGD